MIRIASIITMFFFIGVLTSCNENKKTNDIITRKPEKTHVKKVFRRLVIMSKHVQLIGMALYIMLA